MNKITILGGAGAMGQIIVRDLVSSAPDSTEIVVADYNLSAAESLKQTLKSNRLTAIRADITKLDELAQILTGSAVVINSTPYYHNVNVMEAALLAGSHYIDLGGLFHVTKKQLELHSRFTQKNLLAVLGMGAAPGMTNVMAAEAADQLDTVESIDILVGCADFVEVDHPLATPYALDTILDEYTKEPMVFEDGKYQAKPPMSGEIKLNLPEPVGSCSTILTLHSEVLTLPETYKDKNIKSVTFRLGLPQSFHEKLKLLVQLGFGDSQAIKTVDGEFVPRKILAKLLERFTIPTQTPDDCEVVRVDVKGTKAGRATTIRVESIIFADKDWGVSCGSLDTGVPPSIVAQMILNGDLDKRGVLPPELCVPRQKFFTELEKRKIKITQTEDLPELAAIK